MGALLILAFALFASWLLAELTFGVVKILFWAVVRVADAKQRLPWPPNRFARWPLWDWRRRKFQRP